MKVKIKTKQIDIIRLQVPSVDSIKYADSLKFKDRKRTWIFKQAITKWQNLTNTSSIMLEEGQVWSPDGQLVCRNLFQKPPDHEPNY